MTIREKIESVVKPFVEAFSIPPGVEDDLINKLTKGVRGEIYAAFDRGVNRCVNKWERYCKTSAGNKINHTEFLNMLEEIKGAEEKEAK